MEINCQNITGHLDASNKFCIDWNNLGLIAYASNSSILIVDSYTLKTVQVISNPKGVITKLKWSNYKPENKHQKYVIKLACADESGCVSVWNPNDLRLINDFVDGNHLKVNDMKWYYNTKTDEDYLFILYSGYKFVMWEPISSTRLWSKHFTEQVNQFTIDPHEFGRIALLGTNFIQFINFDYSNNSIVEKSTQKFYLMAQESAASGTDGSKTTINLLANYWRNLIEGDQSKQKTIDRNPQKISLNDCFQIEFHSSIKNVIFLVYSKEIFIFDLIVNQTIGYIQLEKSQNQLVQLYSCVQKDALFLLHENGAISLYIRQQNSEKEENSIFTKGKQPIGDFFNELDSSFVYKNCIQSDSIRLTKSLQIFGFSICPNTEKYLMILFNDGRLLKYEFLNKKSLTNLKAQTNQIKELLLFDNLNDENTKNFKLTLIGMTNVLPNMPFIIKVCSPLTKKNSKIWEPLVAFGCSNGFFYIYNLNKCSMTKKLLLYAHPVMGIEWVTISTVITWSYHGNTTNSNLNHHQDSVSNSSGTKQLVKNEVFFTDLRTGESQSLRITAAEESPIISIKLSNLKQYIAILFKEQPLEIWDLKTFSLIKKISRKSPSIKILEWCLHDLVTKKVETKFPENPDNSVNVDLKTPMIEKLNQEANTIANHKESFVCIDENGLMYSFCVENNTIKDGGKLLPDEAFNMNYTHMALKKEFIIFADIDGNIIKWDIKNKRSNSFPFKKGEAKKIKFAPGKENLLLLIQFADSIEIIEANSFESISMLKINQLGSKFKLIDTDWCSSDKIMCLFSDGAAKIFDLNFKQPYNYINCIPSFSFNTKPLPKLINSEEMLALKNLIYNVIDQTDGKNYDDLIKDLSTKYFNQNKSSQSLLSDLVSNLNKNIFQWLFNKQVKNTDATNIQIYNKIIAYSLFNGYFNSRGFETKFWTLFSYGLNTGFEFSENLNKFTFTSNSIDYRKNEYKKLKFYKEKQNILSKDSELIKDLVLCNELDLVFHTLMETDAQNENYLNNYLKACLIQSLKTSNENPSTQTSIKLVATNLIANGKLTEGVELLCLIGLVFDACRYLQDNGRWEKAAWLAKLRLNDDECYEIIKRWSDNLAITDRKDVSILLLLSCKKYFKVIEVLSFTKYIELAYFYMKICLKLNLIQLEGVNYDEFEALNESFLDNEQKLNNDNESIKLFYHVIYNYFKYKKQFQ